MQSIRCKTRSLRDGRGWNQSPQSGIRKTTIPGPMIWQAEHSTNSFRVRLKDGVTPRRLSELPRLIIGIVYAKPGGGKTTWTCLYKFMQSIPCGNFITKRTSQSFAKLLGCIPFARQWTEQQKTSFLLTQARVTRKDGFATAVMCRWDYLPSRRNFGHAVCQYQRKHGSVFSVWLREPAATSYQTKLEDQDNL